MLQYKINKDKELVSLTKDLVIQTSQNVDEIIVYFDDELEFKDDIIATITFENPKKVRSNEYAMTFSNEDNTIRFLLNDNWFNYVEGIMNFTIRIYDTDNWENYDNDTRVLATTKGSYRIESAVVVGETPTIPEIELEKIYEEISKRTTKNEANEIVENNLVQKNLVKDIQSTTISQDKLTTEKTYISKITTNGTVEQVEIPLPYGLATEEEAEKISQTTYEKNNPLNRVEGLEPIKNSKQIRLNNIYLDSTNKEVSVDLPKEIIYEEDIENVTYHETVQGDPEEIAISVKNAENDGLGRNIVDTYATKEDISSFDVGGIKELVGTEEEPINLFDLEVGVYLISGFVLTYPEAPNNGKIYSSIYNEFSNEWENVLPKALINVIYSVEEQTNIILFNGNISNYDIIISSPNTNSSNVYNLLNIHKNYIGENLYDLGNYIFRYEVEKLEKNINEKIDNIKFIKSLDNPLEATSEEYKNKFVNYNDNDNDKIYYCKQIGETVELQQLQQKNIEEKFEQLYINKSILETAQKELYNSNGDLIIFELYDISGNCINNTAIHIALDSETVTRIYDSLDMDIYNSNTGWTELTDSTSTNELYDLTAYFKQYWNSEISAFKPYTVQYEELEGIIYKKLVPIIEPLELALKSNVEEVQSNVDKAFDMLANMLKIKEVTVKRVTLKPNSFEKQTIELDSIKLEQIISVECYLKEESYEPPILISTLNTNRTSRNNELHILTFNTSSEEDNEFDTLYIKYLEV